MIVIADQSNVMYRAYYSGGKNNVTHPWMGVVRYLQLLRNCTQKVKRKGEKIELIFAGESKTKLLRTIQDPKYKLNRSTNKDESFKKHRKLVSHIHKVLSLPIVSIDGLEGDDVIASIAQNKPESTKIVIFSNDKDLRQLLSFENTIIYQAPGFIYTSDVFEKEYGFSPDKYIFYKVLVGDTSDNVKGVEGWGPVKAKKHVIRGDWMHKLEEGKETDQYWASMEMLRLRYDSSYVPDPIPPFHITEKELSKIMRESEKIYSDKRAAEDVIVALFQLEEAIR